VSCLAGLFRGRLVRPWSHSGMRLFPIPPTPYPAELLDDIERAYEDCLVDPGHIGFDDVNRNLEMGKHPYSPDSPTTPIDACVGSAKRTRA
jgi:hypothetical protein